VGAIRTRIGFDDDLHFDLSQQAVTVYAGIGRGAWSFRAAVGAIVGGTLDGDETGDRHELRPGALAAVSAARQWQPGDGRWFVTGSAAIGVAMASTRSRFGADSERFTAGDLRIGALVGRTFADRFSPYLLARLFGGPVLWTVAGESVSGGDTSHFQLGAGVSVNLPARTSIVIDVSAVGEQALSVGVGWQL
jgi:hypothetical protein